MSGLAKAELAGNNQSLLYQVNYPGCEAFATFRDWSSEYAMQAGDLIGRRKDLCWKAPDNYMRGEWEGMLAQTPQPLFNVNTGRRAPGSM
jgi:hypothetical protein